MTGQDVVNEARTWIGTPFHHQARLKGHGVDCIGLVVGVAGALGLQHADRSDYSRLPDGITLAAELNAQMFKVEKMQAGDVLLFAMPKLPRHVAICSTNGRMVHATSLVDKCVEVTIDKTWLRALRGVYRFKELA